MDQSGGQKKRNPSLEHFFILFCGTRITGEIATFAITLTHNRVMVSRGVWGMVASKDETVLIIGFAIKAKVWFKDEDIKASKSGLQLDACSLATWMLKFSV